MIQELKKTSSILEISNRINELIQAFNEDRAFMDSFKNLPNEELFNIKIEQKEVQNGKTIEIKTTGIYSFSIAGLGNVATVFISNANGHEYFRQDLKSEINNILLSSGAKVMIQGQMSGQGGNVTIKLQKTIITVFEEHTKKSMEVVELLEEIKSLKINYEEQLEDMLVYLDELKSGIRLFDANQRDIQALSARLKVLEDK